MRDWERRISNNRNGEGWKRRGGSAGAGDYRSNYGRRKIGNHEWTRMDTNQNTRLLLKKEVYEVVGCAMEVLNELGHGFHEKPYENALVVEFQLHGIPFLQQHSYEILYNGHNVGLYVP